MHKTIKAVYENGVFKPTSPVEVKEHETVRLIIEDMIGIAAATSGIIPAKSREGFFKSPILPSRWSPIQATFSMRLY